MPLTGVLDPVFGKPIDVAHWNANSPFLLARKNAAALRTVAIYFNCGQEDNYGFEKGAAALHANFLKRASGTNTTRIPAITACRLPVAFCGSYGISLQGIRTTAAALRFSA